MTIKIYNIKNYSTANNNFIEKEGESFDDFGDLINRLKSNHHYHFRVHKDTNYIFFGDLDKYSDKFERFAETLVFFLDNAYNIKIDVDDIKYTVNKNNTGSYHYSVPKLYGKTEVLKHIHQQFNKQYCKNIDTTIYSEHWYRCPNQYKGNDQSLENIHLIEQGDLVDFIIENIPNGSLNLNQIVKIDSEDRQLLTIKRKNNDTLNQLTKVDNTLSVYLDNPHLYKMIFHQCYKQERFEQYESWSRVGMAIKNIFHNQDEAEELFDYYSQKGRNYDGREKTLKTFAAFIKRNDGLTVGTIYYYAMEDNKPKFIEIMNKNAFELKETDICKYLKVLAGYKFVYLKTGNKYELYCYNGDFWENDEIVLRNFLSTDLYEFLKMILTEIYWNSNEFQSLKKQLDRLKLIKFKREIIETYKEIGVNSDINFDQKWHLLGFKNGVYDLLTGEFRGYQYDDYISLHTGYNWREPLSHELDTMNYLLSLVMPDPLERELYLQILSTGLEGHCTEKFVVLNGSGGNGKGMINDILLLALGNYGLIGNNSILFETGRTGSNPEKANIHQKRLVIFREPPAKNKFQTGIIKELTGGGTFSARGHHESQTQKTLHLTMLVECNKRPLFDEEPGNSEIRRIVDIYFRSTFTSNDEMVDPSQHVYKANIHYKTREFQETHKYALLKILMDAHQKYKNNNYEFEIPETIAIRTQEYLEMSCNIVEWFKDNYELSNNRDDTNKLKDIYSCFTSSENYQHLTNAEKRKWSKSKFIDYVKNNIFFRKFYTERTSTLHNFVHSWRKKIDDPVFD